MDIYFYNNHSPANVVDKTLMNETIISGTLKEDVEILNPVITISKQLFNFNYCYIPRFNRYYFIRAQKSDTKNFIKIYLHVDVLKTYGDLIKQSSGQVETNQSKGNGYYNNNPSYDVRYTYREQLNFINPFSSKGENILLAVKTK